MRKITVTFTDGEVQEFNCPSYEDGNPKLHQCEELDATIKDYAGSQVFPSKIVDDRGQHYYCEWDVNIIPCPTTGTTERPNGTMPNNDPSDPNGDGHGVY